MTNLVFPVGIPGSGKSTWARTMLQNYTVLSSDEIRKELFGSLRAAHDVTPEEKKRRNERVWDIFYARVAEELLHGQSVYADATNLRGIARGRLKGIAEKTNAGLHVIVFDNAGQAWRRNTERDSDLHVPKDVMIDFEKQFKIAKHDILNSSGVYSSVTIIGGLY